MLSFIVFSWFFNLSFMPNECYAVNNSFCQEKNAIVTEIGLDATLWNRLTIAGSVESFEFPAGFDSGMPNFNIYSINSKISANLRVTPDNSKVEVNLYASHECRHPVNPWKEDLSTYNYGSTRYGLKLSGKF